MFVYKENNDLMRRDTLERKRREGHITKNGGSTNTIDNSLRLEDDKKTSIEKLNNENNRKIPIETPKIRPELKKDYPSYDVKIIGGKKVVERFEPPQKRRYVNEAFKIKTC